MTSKELGSETIIEMDNKTKRMIFPPSDNINYDDIQITDVGKYSISTWTDSEKISNIIIKNSDKNSHDIVITDGTSGIGGNVISFCNNFKFVNAVELSSVHCSVLENNVKTVYNNKNVNIVCNDYTKIYSKLVQDVVFLDPPWGGPDYKKYDELDLYLGEHNLAKFVGLLKPYAKMVVIKVPHNFNIKKLVDYGDFTTYKKYRLKKYLIFVMF